MRAERLDQIIPDLSRQPYRPADTMDLARTIRDILARRCVDGVEFTEARDLAERLVEIYPTMVGPEWTDDRVAQIERRLDDHSRNYRSWRNDLRDAVRRLREVGSAIERVRAWTRADRAAWPIAKACVASLLAGAPEPIVAISKHENQAGFIARSREAPEYRATIEALPGALRRQRADMVADAFDHVASCDLEACERCRGFALSWGLDTWKQIRGFVQSPLVKIVRAQP